MRAVSGLAAARRQADDLRLRGRQCDDLRIAPPSRQPDPSRCSSRSLRLSSCPSCRHRPARACAPDAPDLRQAGSTIRAGLELAADILDADRAAGGEGGANRVQADAEAGADDRAGIGRAVEPAAGEQGEPVLRRWPGSAKASLTVSQSGARAGRSQRTARRRACRRASRRSDRCRPRGRSSRPGRPRRRWRGYGPSARRPRRRWRRAGPRRPRPRRVAHQLPAGSANGIAREHEALRGIGDGRDARGRRLHLGLAGIGIAERLHRRADAGMRGRLGRPVDRREERARLACRDRARP